MKASITIGMSFDKNGQPVEKSEELLTQLLEISAIKFGGASAHKHLGSYQYTDGPKKGEVVIEDSVTIDILTDDEQAVKDFAEIAKHKFRQESVLVVKETNQYDFV